MSKKGAWAGWKETAGIRRDVRASADGPEVTGKPKKKKDTRRWCKGVEGREHVLDLRINSMGTWWIQQGARKTACYYSSWKVHHPDGTFHDGDRWSCSHERYCTKCGKIVEWSLGEACPDKAAFDATMGQRHG